MKKTLFFTFVIFTLISQAQFVDKPFEQLINNERLTALKHQLRQPLANTGNYDVKFHRISLNPSLTTRALSGTVVTYFEPVQNITSMEFDLNTQMSVSQVTWHNQNLTFSQANNTLNISFPQALPNRVLDSIAVSYNGNVPSTGLDSYAVMTHGNNIPVVWTLSEPYGARDWWPCKQDLTDKADSVEIKITYPANYNGQNMVAVSNGLLVSEQTQSGTKTSVWKHRYPIAAYLVAFAITNYTKFSQTAGTTQNFPIDNYVYPENLQSAQANSVNFVPVMNFFENTFGPYPFNQEKYGQIQFGWGGGMEHQTATFLVNYERSLVAHELGHQWFGDAITCGSWHDIWLNEGFATYSEALVREHFDGQNIFDNWKSDVNFYITSLPDGSVYVQDTTDISRIFSSRLTYRKGAMVLNMLRLKLGDTDFFNGIRQYFNAYKFQYAKTPDFRMEMENVSGKNLQEFFDDWIYGEGYPTYTININRTGAGQYDVEVSQTTSHASVDFFEMPLPFKFIGINGQTYETILNHTSNGQHFTVNTGFEAGSVLFDEHYDIVKGPTALNLTLSLDLNSRNVLKTYPNPVYTYLYLDNATNIPVKSIEILSPGGKVIKQFSSGFERINVNGLAKGVYFIKIATSQGIVIKKLLKK